LNKLIPSVIIFLWLECEEYRPLLSIKIIIAIRCHEKLLYFYEGSKQTQDGFKEEDKGHIQTDVR
jgi:hypothetical protein